MEHKYLEKTVRMVETLQQQLAAAQRALKWYAEVNYYKHDPSSHTYPTAIIDTDRGQVARDAQAEIERIKHDD